MEMIKCDIFYFSLLILSKPCQYGVIEAMFFFFFLHLLLFLLASVSDEKFIY